MGYNERWLHKLNGELAFYANMLHVHISNLPVQVLRIDEVPSETFEELQVNKEHLVGATRSMLMSVIAGKREEQLQHNKRLFIGTGIFTCVMLIFLIVLALCGYADIARSLFGPVVMYLAAMNAFTLFACVLMQHLHEQSVELSVEPLAVYNIETTPLAFLATVQDIAHSNKRVFGRLNWLGKSMDKALRALQRYSDASFLEQSEMAQLQDYFDPGTESYRTHCGLYPCNFTLVVWRTPNHRPCVSWYIHKKPTLAEVQEFCEVLGDESSDDMSAYMEYDLEYKRVYDNFEAILREEEKHDGE